MQNEPPLQIAVVARRLWEKKDYQAVYSGFGPNGCDEPAALVVEQKKPALMRLPSAAG
ncbi:hypothetical protein [Acidaminococcus sp.]|uniref:hypothetical protein n=1 Tax=Acidaminococcus sp. TaxID=1872103 RepID=UPI003AB5E6D4